MSDVQVVRSAVASFASVLKSAGNLDRLADNQLQALRTQGADLLSQVDETVESTGTVLDAGDPSVNPAQYLDSFLLLGESADDASVLSDIRGLTGRIVFNLNKVI